MSGGPAGGELLLLGLDSGIVVQVFVNNAFPMELVKAGAAIVCCDMSLHRKQARYYDTNIETDTNTVTDTMRTRYGYGHGNGNGYGLSRKHPVGWVGKAERVLVNTPCSLVTASAGFVFACVQLNQLAFGGLLCVHPC